MPSSGRCQAFSRKLEERLERQPGVGAPREPHFPPAVNAGQHLTVDVQLELPGGGIPYPHRLRPLVSREPVEFELGKPARAGDVVHDLQICGIAGHDAQQPVAERARLVEVSADH